jgi:small subunit ribosomal protein S1
MKNLDDGQEEDEDFGALLAESERRDGGGRGGRLEVGDTVQGRVVSIGRQAVVVDLGGKAEGLLAVAEVQDETGKIAVAVGETIEARVVETDGRTGGIVLRRRAGRGPGAREELREAFESKVPVEGTVTGVNKGGVEVQVAGVRAFCPISQLDRHRVDDAQRFVGLRLAFRVTKYEPGPRSREPNVVLSRRAVLEDEERARAAELRARLVPGAVLKGKVTALRDYGAFVDLGGIDGMLHVSEIGFARVRHPRDVLGLGQEVEVQVLRVEESGDPARPARIALSLKSLERDPWTDVSDRFPAQQRARGKVVRVEAFGAFVELAPGVEGLVHVSELAQGRAVRHAREVARPGQELDVLVLEVDPARRRISLAVAEPGDEAPPAARLLDDGRHDKLGDLLGGVRKSRANSE